MPRAKRIQSPGNGLGSGIANQLGPAPRQNIGDKTAILTDNDLFIQSYIGGNDVFGFVAVGERCGVISRNAAVEYSGTLYWMATNGQFYQYDGRVQTLPCDLRRHVFSDFNQSQAAQVYAGTNEGFNEVWWFYCAAGSLIANRYIVYNYLEKVWYYGTMERTAWLDSGLRDFPIAATYNYN